MEQPFIMPADVYDAIDIVSEAEGGLVGSEMYTDDGRCGCMVGAAHFAGVIGGSAEDLYTPEAQEARAKIMPHYSRFDSAHTRLSDWAGERLPWTVVAQEANIVRGS